MTLEDKIYEAAFFPGLWPDILHALSGAIGAEGALIANISHEKTPWISSPGVTALYEDFFSGGWAYDNAKTKTLLAIQHQGLVSDADYMTDAWMAEQPVYRDFLWTRGYGYAAGTTIRTPSGDTIGISIEKKRHLGHARRNDLADCPKTLGMIDGMRWLVPELCVRRDLSHFDV